MIASQSACLEYAVLGAVAGNFFSVLVPVVLFSILVVHAFRFCLVKININ